jgi:hypothetical protein
MSWVARTLPLVVRSLLAGFHSSESLYRDHGPGITFASSINLQSIKPKGPSPR